MAIISDKLNKILSAVFGKDVRQALHDGLDAINKETESTTSRQDYLDRKYDEQIKNMTLQDPSSAEIVDMRVAANGTTFEKAGDRLNYFDEQLVYIENEKADNLKVNSLEVRLNNIIAHNGEGTKDTELIDARGDNSTLGERLYNIDSNGYIFKDCVEVGGARYINSWDVGKGWGTVFSPSQLSDITHIELKKTIVAGTSRKVTTDVTITLFECNSATISGVNNAIVLEKLIISAEEWNEYNDETSIILKLNEIHSINLNKYYGVTVYNSDRINCSQVGYNTSYESIEQDTKTSSFLLGIWTNETDNLSNYKLVSGNTYGLYVKLRGSNYKKQIKIKQEQVEGLKEFTEEPITLEKLPFLSTEYTFIGDMIETGSKSIQYDNISKWATVIKGADFEIDRFILNKYNKSSIDSDVSIKFYECSGVTDWINIDPIIETNILATDFNSMELGEFEILLNQNILCSKDKYYVVRVDSESVKLGLAQSGVDATGNDGISKYFIDGYYYNNSTWNKVANKYGLYFKLKSIDYGSLVKIKYEQVEGLKEKNTEIESRLEILEVTNDNVKVKEEYIDVYNDSFVNNTNWIDNNSNWIFSNGLTPKSVGETNVNNIKLNKPYHSDKRIMRFDINLFSDTVLDISMTRSNNNTGEGESIYRIDIPNKRLIMFGAASNSRGVDLSNLLKVTNINFNIVDGNKYLIEVEKNDFSYYFRIKDYLTANITEIELEGWGAGRQNHNYGFSWIAGENAPTINNFKISMLNNPTCVFVGDSITEGVGMASIDMNNENNYTYRYAEILRNKLGNSVISAMGGDTIGTIISKFDSEYNHIKPKAISVTIGTNGGVNSNTLEQFKTLIDKSYSIGSKLIINLVPCGYSGNYLGVNENLLLLKQDESYKDKFILGCQFDVATAVNYYPHVDSEHTTTIIGQNTRVDSSLMTDNTHPNKAGSIRMANRYAVDVPEIFNL